MHAHDVANKRHLRNIGSVERQVNSSTTKCVTRRRYSPSRAFCWQVACGAFEIVKAICVGYVGAKKFNALPCIKEYRKGRKNMVRNVFKTKELLRQHLVSIGIYYEQG